MMSRNLQKRMQHLTLIEDWYDNYPYYDLSTLFSNALGVANVFSSIYVAIRKNPENASQAETETWNYYNVGADMKQITNYFVAKYGLNYFAYNFNSGEDCTNLKNRVEAIYNANLYKYRKLVEVLGYTYNPLYNVDGTELYSHAESIGDAASNRQPSGTITTTTGTKINNVIGASEAIFYKNPYDENSENISVVDSKNKQSAITSEQSYSEDYQDKTDFENIPAYNYIYDEQQGKWIKSGVFEINAKDNAFGVQFNGPERYYAEKRIRQGNIGVTKSTELLEAQRNLVRFNILDEFFKDLEPHIVVGIY